MSNTPGDYGEVFKPEVTPRPSMDAFDTVWGKLRVASYVDENDEEQSCYMDSRGQIFRIDGEIVISRSDTVSVNGVEYEPAGVEGGVTKYYDKYFNTLTQEGPHPRIAYRLNGGECFIDEILKEYDTVWGKVRRVQHNHAKHANSCNHFFIDENNNIIECSGEILTGIGETKEINGKLYTQVNLNDGSKRFYDVDFQPLPIEPGVEEDDNSILEVKNINGVNFAIKNGYYEHGRMKSFIVDNNSQSHVKYTGGSLSGTIKFLEPLMYDGTTYLIISYGSKSEQEQDKTTILVLNEDLSEPLEYPIWDVDINRVESTVKSKLNELIPEEA